MIKTSQIILNFIRIFMKKLKKVYLILLKIQVINPNNPLKLFWDVINLINMLIIIFYIPTEICFQFSTSSFLIISYPFFIIDIILRLNTGVFYKGIISNERISIFKNYYNTYFHTDLILLAVIIYDIILKNSITKSSNVAILMLKNLPKLIWAIRLDFCKKNLEFFLEKLQLEQKFHSLKKLLNLILISAFNSHILACLWHFIAIYDSNGGNKLTWLHRLNIVNFPWEIRYLHSFYWSTITIFTVGYGDISAKTNKEIIFCIFTVFYGCCLFAYIINSIGNILKEINYDEKIFRLDF